MKIILKSILVSLFILFVTINSKGIKDIKGVSDVITDAYKNFETLTHDPKDNSNIFILSDKNNVFYVRKVSKSQETLWETELKKAPKNEPRSISIIVDSTNDSIFISGTFNQDDDSVVLVMKLDSKQGEILWTVNLGAGYQLGNNNIGLNSQNKSIFTIKNRDYKSEVNMHLIKLDSEDGFVLKRNVKKDISSYDYYQYESLVVNSEKNTVYVLESYVDNYGGKDINIRKFNKDLEFSTEKKFYFSEFSENRIILNENDGSIYLGYDLIEQDSKKNNKFVLLDSNLNLLKKFEFEEIRDHDIKNKLSAITLNRDDDSLVYISAVKNKKESSFQVFLNRLSSNGDVILKKPLQFKANNLPTTITLNNDGSILVAGNEYENGKGFYALKIE